MSRATALRCLALLLLGSGVVVALVFLPVNQWITDFLAWVQDLGPWGPILLAVAYVPAAVLLVPGSLMTIGAGAAFGVLVGTVTVSVGSTLGASAAFLLGRTLARGWVERKVAGNPRFAALDGAVGEQGFKIVLLLRLSPVFPFNFLNYALGLTRIPFRTYVLASWLGMLPGTVMYVYVGSALGSLADLGAERSEESIGQKVFFWCGLAATVVVTIVITRMARRTLAAAAPRVTEPTNGSSTAG
jgi:uncharacterized membrane protein YdjX (TVP38/TMEM64 family)